MYVDDMKISLDKFVRHEKMAFVLSKFITILIGIIVIQLRNDDQLNTHNYR